jgi:hypothetical protein
MESSPERLRRVPLISVGPIRKGGLSFCGTWEAGRRSVSQPLLKTLLIQSQDAQNARIGIFADCYNIIPFEGP